MTASWLKDNDAAATEVEGICALHRIGETRDIADVVAFLASDDARSITGTTIDATSGQQL
jgi:3-oxoacyl-[acyl-carrier protein] reductase